MAHPNARTRFTFAFEDRYRLPARLAGVRPETAWVELDDDRLEARFGPWAVRTPLANVAAAQITGPYGVLKTIGPAHLSFEDRGLTFATNSRKGVCISFEEPVKGMDPMGLLKHPGLTVTVADPDGLVEAVESRRGR